MLAGSKQPAGNVTFALAEAAPHSLSRTCLALKFVLNLFTSDGNEAIPLHPLLSFLIDTTAGSPQDSSASAGTLNLGSEVVEQTVILGNASTDSPNGSSNRIMAGMGEPSQPGAWASTFRSLRHRNYRLYFFGQLASITGFWMQMTALRWLAYDLTEESRWVAWIATANNLPMVFLAGVGGALADRWPKRTLIAATQSAFLILTLLLTGVVLANRVTPHLLIGFAVVNGIIHALDLPARLSLVKEMVGREDLMNAVALNSFQFNVARIVGPWIGGVTLAAWGPWPCFLANALTYGVVVLCVLRMQLENAVPRAAGDFGSGGILAGISYLAGQPALATVILLAAAVSFFGWPFMELLPALARNYLGEQEVGYSRLMSGMGVGALTAALTVAAFGTPQRRKVFLAAGIAAVLAGLASLSASRELWLAGTSSGLIGLGLILFMTTAQTSVQIDASDEHRGRVLGVWAMAWSGAPPLANLLFGPAADRWGEPVVLRLMALGLVVAAAALWAGRLRPRRTRIFSR